MTVCRFFSIKNVRAATPIQ